MFFKEIKLCKLYAIPTCLNYFSSFSATRSKGASTSHQKTTQKSTTWVYLSQETFIKQRTWKIDVEILDRFNKIKISMH